LADPHESVALIERQAAQDDGIDDGEDRSARANAQREDDQGDGRETGCGP
jgi:hypothetical protein